MTGPTRSAEQRGTRLTALPFTSAAIARASAAVLLLGGLALLFAADVILPRLVPGLPAAGAWLGQLLGAAWLAVAALDWMGRSLRIGGIYGRAMVMANATLYFVSAMVLLKSGARGDAPMALRIAGAVAVLFAAIYGWLLLRGPLDQGSPPSERSPVGR